MPAELIDEQELVALKFKRVENMLGIVTLTFEKPFRTLLLFAVSNWIQLDAQSSQIFLHVSTSNRFDSKHLNELVLIILTEIGSKWNKNSSAMHFAVPQIA